MLKKYTRIIFKITVITKIIKQLIYYNLNFFSNIIILCQLINVLENILIGIIIVVI